tara:strand:+ start:79 stop:1161 length:1083 start_codon:yes stop_codon:yes gene_type:complete
MIEKTNPTKRLFSDLADQIRSEIVSNRFESETISEKLIMEKYGVARNTAMKSLIVLEGMGWVVRCPGKGTVIVKNKKALKNTINVMMKISSIGDDLFHQRSWTASKIINAMGNEARNLHVNLRILFLHQDDTLEEKVDSILAMGANHAFVALYENHMDEIIPSLVSQKVPYIVRTYPHGEFNQIGVETCQITQKAVNYLINTYNTKKVLFLYPNGGLDNHIKGRFDGYCQALKKNNIEFDQDWVMPIHPHHPKLLRLDREQLENAILNTSVVFAANGSCGLVAYETLKAMNLKMPDDKPLLVYDDFDDFDKIDPTISAIRSNYEEIGKLLIQKSNEMINKGFRNDLRIQVNGQLMLRDTA